MIFGNLINALFVFVSIGINIMFFFLVVRLLVNFKIFKFLETFDEAGKKLVDATLSKTSHLFNKLFKKELTKNGQVAISMLILILTDSLLALTSKAIIAVS